MTAFETIKEKWHDLLLDMKDEHEMMDVSYKTWLKPLRLFDLIEKNLIVIVPEEGFIRLLEKKYAIPIKVAVEEATGYSVEIQFMTEKDAEAYRAKINGQEAGGRGNHPPDISRAMLDANLNPKYTFDSFVVGSSNNLAHAASLAVAESPGDTYNPLYIYGGAGLGKTHLMHSIAHFILKTRKNARIRYVTSEAFTNDFIDAIRNKNKLTASEFRKKYRDVDILLIDDIQFIVGKEGTQEEFFHTFNTLYENERQIVVASDKPPRNIDNLEERLRSRFEWGLIVDIQMPNYETRMAILRKKEEMEHANIDNEVIKYIATNIKSNVRELEGALTKIIAASRISKNTVITEEVAAQLLRDHITEEPREVTAESIIATVAEHFKISMQDIASQRKNREIAYPRQIAMYLCRELTDTPLEYVGKLLGGRDHTTIMYGQKKISADLRTNTQLQSTMDTLRKKILPNGAKTAHS